MKIYETNSVTLSYYPETSLCYVKWHGFANSVAYRKLLDKALELVLKNDVKYWLANTTNMKVIRPIDQEYTNEVWFPEFVKSNVKKMAIITSTDFFNRLSVDKILTKAGGLIKFDTKHFDNIDEAMEWLGIDRGIIKE